jgi:hypothetical protein
VLFFVPTCNVFFSGCEFPAMANHRSGQVALSRDVQRIRALAVGTRGDTDETCLRRFKRVEMTESAADFVCIIAGSNH